MFIFNQLRELGDAICRAVVCFLCLGPVLALVGIGFLAATSNDSRGSQVSSFNAAASSWSNGGASAFAAVPFALVGPAGTAGATLTLVLESTKDAYGTDSASLSPPNMTSRWAASTLSGRPFSSTPYIYGQSVTASVTLKPSGTYATSPLNVQLFKTATKSIECKSGESASTCSGRCSSSGGSWASNTCTKYFRLTSICVVVDPTTRQLDSAGGAGCNVIPSSSSDSGYNVASFAGGSAGTQSSLGMYAFSSSSSQFSPSDFSGVLVTVRASSDPYVNLLRATSGTLSLDLSTESKGTIGGALLAVGIVITTITCLTIYYLIRCVKRRNQPQVGAAAMVYDGQPAYQVAYGGVQKPQPEIIVLQQQQQQQQQQGGQMGYAGAPMMQGGAPVQMMQMQGQGQQPMMYGGQVGYTGVPQQGAFVYAQPQGGYPMQQAGYAVQPQAMQYAQQPQPTPMYAPAQPQMMYAAQQPAPGYAQAPPQQQLYQHA